MNIKKAKETVEATVVSYLTKNEYGEYEIPTKEQRPIFLMGAPGIGKTDIMSQVASELGISLLTYSMTHHTRQSAIGLPIIKTKTYHGEEFTVSEYTMPEIISSIHEMIEKTGKQTGILFLDEINCVSETLSPIMLRFLQYKEFGNYVVPEGWIVVTAGNPPEYNNSVHDFDIVTWDRLKRIDIEPDFEIWKTYAYTVGVHPSIISYLESKKSNFYSIEQTVDGKNFVTARGWTDLSKIILLYEKNGYDVDKDLVFQYIRNEKIARDYAVYYDLYKKYKSDYHVTEIINGEWTDEIMERAQNAPYDEKFSLIGLLIECMGNDAKAFNQQKAVRLELCKKLKAFAESKDVVGDIEGLIQEYRDQLNAKKITNNISSNEKDNILLAIKLLEKYAEAARKLPDNPYGSVVTAFNIDNGKYQVLKKTVAAHFENIFKFGDEAFGKESQQLLIICTEAVASPHISRYIGDANCPAYFEHDELLMFHKRNMEIIRKLGDLEELENM